MHERKSESKLLRASTSSVVHAWKPSAPPSLPPLLPARPPTHPHRLAAEQNFEMSRNSVAHLTLTLYLHAGTAGYPVNPQRRSSGGKTGGASSASNAVPDARSSLGQGAGCQVEAAHRRCWPKSCGKNPLPSRGDCAQWEKPSDIVVGPYRSARRTHLRRTALARTPQPGRSMRSGSGVANLRTVGRRLASARRAPTARPGRRGANSGCA
jgi:hypothetical protein